jgi:hypothetical protein
VEWHWCSLADRLTALLGQFLPEEEIR